MKMKISAALLTLTTVLGLAACGGGKAQEYVDTVCACKDAPCIADAAKKYADNVKDMNQDQAKKLGDCTQKIATGK